MSDQFCVAAGDGGQARRHGFRAGGARKIWRALSLFFDDYGAL